MKYNEKINHDLSTGDAFIGTPLQSVQNVVSFEVTDCSGISADASLELYAGSDKHNLEPAKYMNGELGIYEVVTLIIASGSDKGVLRIKDISQGEYFQLKAKSGSGILGTLKINY